MFFILKWGEGDIDDRFFNPYSPDVEFLKNLALMTGVGGLLVTMVGYMVWTFVPPGIKWFWVSMLLPKDANILPRW